MGRLSVSETGNRERALVELPDATFADVVVLADPQDPDTSPVGAFALGPGDSWQSPPRTHSVVVVVADGKAEITTVTGTVEVDQNIGGPIELSWTAPRGDVLGSIAVNVPTGLTNTNAAVYITCTELST